MTLEVNHRLLKLFITEPNLDQLTELIEAEYETSGSEAYFTIKDLIRRGVIEVVSFDIVRGKRTQYYAITKTGYLKPDYVAPYKPLSFLPSPLSWNLHE
jgi:hypothetical protein